MAFLDNKEVGNRLKEKRKLTNLSARQFAMKAEVDQSQYAKIERGDLPITENIMDKLVKVHGLDKNSILHGTDVPRGTKNDSTGHSKPRQGGQPEKQEQDLIKEVSRLNEQQITIEATLSVILSEVAPLIAKATGRSHASVFSQMKKDISTEILNLKSLMDKR